MEPSLSDVPTTVLVTGATGLLGRALCGELLEAGWRVRAVSRSPERAGDRLPEGVGVVGWDGRTLEPEALEDVDAVVHLAGESVAGRWTSARRRAIRESRIRGTAALVAVMGALPHRPRTLVCASAVGFYGDQGDDALTEDSAPGGGFLSDVCRDWEAAALEAESLGLRVVTLRYGIILSPEGGALARMLPPARLGLGGPLGGGRQWWSWIHRQDAARLIRYALDTKELSGPVNGTSPNPVRQGDFARELGRVLGRPAIFPTPGFAIRAVAGGFADEILTSKRVLPERAQAAGFSYRFPELAEALEDLVGG